MFKRKSLSSNILFLSLLLFLSFTFLLINLNQPINNYDEGIAVYGALQILNGKLPYGDFWTLYAPGQFYILSGWFRIFGASILIERLWDTFVRSLLSLIVFLIARKLVSQTMSLISWFVTVIWLAYFGFYGYPLFPALLLSMVSVLFLINFLSQGQKLIWLIASGISVGIETLFRHDLGFYTFTAELLWMIFFAFFNLRRIDRSELWKPTGPIFPYFLSVVVVLLPPTLYFMNKVPLHDLAYDLVIFPTTIFPRVRSIPYPAPLPNPLPILEGKLSILSFIWLIVDRIPFYFPLLVYIPGIVIVIAHIRKGYLVDIKIWVMMLLILVGLISFNQTRIRSDLIHLPQVFLPAVLLVSPLLRHYLVKKRGIINLSLVILTILAYSAIFIKPTDSSIRKAYASILSPSVISHGIERASHVHVNQDQAEAVRYIQSHVHKGELIYVGNSRHDIVYNSDIMFYFLAERGSATKYYELHPGITTTLSVQQEIVKDVKQNKVQYIVLLSRFENHNQPNESSVSSGVKLIDYFIRSNYRVTQHFGDYTIWEKR